MACRVVLPRLSLALAAARAGAAPGEGRRMRGGPAANFSGAAPGQGVREERARELGGATGQCVASGNKCGYNGYPWCANHEDMCCCDSGNCAPRLGNAEGVIDMQCYPADTCINPAEDPSQALCGAGGQQQIPCCGDAVCQPIAGSEGESGRRLSSGGVLMACAKRTSTSPTSTSTSTTAMTTSTSPTTSTSSGPGCTRLSGTYCGGTGQECNCNYCDDFCQDTPCARTCRVLNGYFSSPAQSTCQWSAAYVTHPSPDASGNSCWWMQGNGQGGNGDDCRNCDQYAVACRRSNPSGNCRA